MQLALFHSGSLTQSETINLLTLAVYANEPNQEELGLDEFVDAQDIRDSLRMMENGVLPFNKDVKTILRRLGIVPRKLVRIDQESAKKQKNLQKCYQKCRIRSMSRFLNRDASQQETIAILISAPQDSTLKSLVLDADKNGNLDKNTRFLFQKLGVLPRISA